MRTSRIESERRQNLPQAEIKNHGFFTTALCALFVAMAAPALAVDAIWRPDPAINGDWNNNTNWIGGMAPVNAGDTATFNFASVTHQFLSSGVTIDSMTFNPGASAFSIDTSGNSFSFVGAGIMNNSGVTQTIINTASGSTSFLNSSTAGNATLVASGGVDFYDTSNGSIAFFDSSTADNATLVAGGGANAPGGTISFHGTSTAGNATLIAYGGQPGAFFPIGGGGSISFSDNSTAGNATLIAKAGVGGMGSISFSGNSTAGNATLTAEGGGGCSLCSGGAVISFSDNSTAGNATLIAQGGLEGEVFGGGGGSISFSGNSTAGNATITSERSPFGGPGGVTLFSGNSSAANATLIAEGGLRFPSGFIGPGGTILFVGQSLGGTARVEVFGNGELDISSHITPSVTVGSIEGDGAVLLGGNNLTVGSNNLSTLFSGQISDDGEDGSLTKVGTGTLTLTGLNNVATRNTTVNGGSLIVDGSISSRHILVNAGGLLGGNGSLDGNLLNRGLVSPGNSTGTLTVTGNYTQTAGATLRLEVAGLGGTAHDLLAINGKANLSGTLQIIRLNNFQLSPGDQITLLTANGGVNGTFNTLQNDFGTMTGIQIVYLPDSVRLEATQGSFKEFAKTFCGTPNDVAVGAALDSAVTDSRMTGVIEFLDSESLIDLCRDLELISPEQLAAIFNIGVSLANIQSVNLERRMEDIRASSSGFSTAGFTINTGAREFRMGLTASTGPEGKSGKPVMQPTPENRWGVFVTGLGEFSDVDDTSIARGYDLSTGGLTFGVDYRVCPNFAIGLTGGYAHTNADLADNGRLDVDGGTIGVYATGFGGGFYIDAAATGGFNGYDIHRTALLGTASGDTGGCDFTALAAAGYDWKSGGLAVGPLASFQYTYIEFDGFTEHGSLAPLKFKDQHADSARTALGAKASYDWHVGHILVRPEIRAFWQHEFGDRDYSIVSGFANGAGNSFIVNGPAIGRDSLLVGAGVAVLFNDRVSAYAYYDGELARSNYSSNNVSAGVRVSF